MPVILQSLRPGLVLLALLAVVAGGLYPWLVRALAENGLNTQLDQAALRDRSGRIVATSLSGPGDEALGHVWGRIRTAATVDCDGAGDGPACAAAITARINALKAADSSGGPVPPELIAFDGDGLDPTVGINAARYQAPRIARARHMRVAEVNALIDATARNAVYNTTRGVTVNRLELNRRLDGTHP